MHIGRRRPSKRNYTNSSITLDTDAMIRCLHKRYAMCLAMCLTKDLQSQRSVDSKHETLWMVYSQCCTVGE